MDSITFQKLRDIEDRFALLQAQMSEPAVAQDPSAFQKLARESKDITLVVERYRAYKDTLSELTKVQEMAKAETDPELREMAHEESHALEVRRDALSAEIPLLLIPKDPNDEKNVLLEIRAGTGGDEAALFAGEVFRMYSRYAERQGWKIDVISVNRTGQGGLKEVIALIEGNRVYSKLRFESGVHRVQRVPATEASGRIHTSAITVAVLPEAEEVDVKIEAKDLRIDTFCSSGPGGQSVNTTYSAVRITHLPTSTVVSCQDEKSQIKNREKAMKVLRARLYEVALEEQQKAIASDRKNQVGSGDRSEKIRTYNFNQGRVTDHRIGLTLHRLQDVLDGDLDEVVGSLIAHNQAAKLKGAGPTPTNERKGEKKKEPEPEHV
jgi:peptide chain release factor 1